MATYASAAMIAANPNAGYTLDTGIKSSAPASAPASSGGGGNGGGVAQPPPAAKTQAQIDSDLGIIRDVRGNIIHDASQIINETSRAADIAGQKLGLSSSQSVELNRLMNLQSINPNAMELQSPSVQSLLQQATIVSPVSRPTQFQNVWTYNAKGESTGVKSMSANTIADAMAGVLVGGMGQVGANTFIRPTTGYYSTTGSETKYMPGQFDIAIKNYNYTPNVHLSQARSDQLENMFGVDNLVKAGYLQPGQHLKDVPLTTQMERALVEAERQGYIEEKQFRDEQVAKYNEGKPKLDLMLASYSTSPSPSLKTQIISYAQSIGAMVNFGIGQNYSPVLTPTAKSMAMLSAAGPTPGGTAIGSKIGGGYIFMSGVKPVTTGVPTGGVKTNTDILAKLGGMLEFGNLHAASVPQITSGSPEQAFLYSSGMPYGAGMKPTSAQNEVLARLGVIKTSTSPFVQPTQLVTPDVSKSNLVNTGRMSLQDMVTGTMAAHAAGQYVPSEYQKYILPIVSAAELKTMTAPQIQKYYSDRGMSSTVVGMSTAAGETFTVIPTGITNQGKFLANSPDAQKAYQAVVSQGGQKVTLESTPAPNGAGFTFTAKPAEVTENIVQKGTTIQQQVYLPWDKVTTKEPVTEVGFFRITTTEKVPVYVGETRIGGTLVPGKTAAQMLAESQASLNELEQTEAQAAASKFLAGMGIKGAPGTIEGEGSKFLASTAAAPYMISGMVGNIINPAQARLFTSQASKLGLGSKETQASAVEAGKGPVMVAGIAAGAHFAAPVAAGVASALGASEATAATFGSGIGTLVSKGIPTIFAGLQVLQGGKTVDASGKESFSLAQGLGRALPFVAFSAASIADIKAATTPMKTMMDVKKIDTYGNVKVSNEFARTGTSYTGLYRATGEGAGTPIIGISETGRVVLGTPKSADIPSFAKTQFPSPSVNIQTNPATPLETALYAKPELMKDAGFSPNEIGKVQLVQKEMGVITKMQNQFILTELPKVTKVLDERGVTATLDLAKDFFKQGKIEKIYGSFTEVAQRNPQYARVPGDIEIQFKSLAGRTEFVNKIADKYKALGYKDVVVETNKLGEPTGSVYIGKGHALDLHYNNEPQELSYQNVGGNMEYGYLRSRPTIKYQGMKIQTIQEQMVNRGGAATRYQTLSTGEKIAGPADFRAKEVPDVYAILKTFGQDEAATQWRNFDWSKSKGVAEKFAELDKTIADYAKTNDVSIKEATKAVAMKEIAPTGMLDITPSISGEASGSYLTPTRTTLTAMAASPMLASAAPVSTAVSFPFSTGGAISPPPSPITVKKTSVIVSPAPSVSTGVSASMSTSTSGTSSPLTVFSPPSPPSFIRSPYKYSNAPASPSVSPPPSAPSTSVGISSMSTGISSGISGISGPSGPSPYVSLPVSPGYSPGSPGYSGPSPGVPPSLIPTLPTIRDLTGFPYTPNRRRFAGRRVVGFDEGLADLVSVTQSQFRYGKATSPSFVKRPYLWQTSMIRTPTLEQIENPGGRSFIGSNYGPRRQPPAPQIARRMSISPRSNMNFGRVNAPQIKMQRASAPSMRRLGGFSIGRRRR